MKLRFCSKNHSNFRSSECTLAILISCEKDVHAVACHIKASALSMDNDPVLRSYLEFVSRAQKRWPVLAKLMGFGILIWVAYSVYGSIWAATNF